MRARSSDPQLAVALQSEAPVKAGEVREVRCDPKVALTADTLMVSRSSEPYFEIQGEGSLRVGARPVPLKVAGRKPRAYSLGSVPIAKGEAVVLRVKNTDEEPHTFVAAIFGTVQISKEDRFS